MENGGENRAFTKKLGRDRAVLESGAENSGILENGVEKSSILENGAENRTFLKTGPKYGKRAGTQRRGSSEKSGLKMGLHENGRKEQLAREGWSSKVKQA